MPNDCAEIETAKLHGGWPAWCRLPAPVRGRLIAYEHVKHLREHYQFDRRRALDDAELEVDAEGNTRPRGAGKGKGEEPGAWARKTFFGG